MLGSRDRARLGVEDMSSNLFPRMHRGQTHFRAQGAVEGKRGFVTDMLFWEGHGWGGDCVVTEGQSTTRERKT